MEGPICQVRLEGGEGCIRPGGICLSGPPSGTTSVLLGGHEKRASPDELHARVSHPVKRYLSSITEDPPFG